jgi:hypothetical protein
VNTLAATTFASSAPVRARTLARFTARTVANTAAGSANPPRNGAKTKPVLYLENEKPMVLNASNLEALSDAFGDDTDEWPGHKIKVRCVKTQFQGKTVDGLRVEPIVPKPALKDDLNDQINF